MKRTYIEPGLLSLFRLGTAIALVLAIINTLFNVFDDSLSPAEVTPWLMHAVDIFTFGMTLLVLYSQQLQNRLGRWYLPLPLLITFVGVFISYGIEIQWALNQNAIPIEWIVEDDALITQLFIPLIIISAQYRYRVVLLFSFLVASLNATIGSWWLPLEGSAIEHVMEYAITVLIIYPIVGFMITRVVSGQKMERQALTAKNIELTQYVATVERLTISHERNRMARELHDTLAHTLSAVSVQLEAVNMQLDSDTQGAKQTLQKSRTLIRNGLQETRRALQSLRASPLEDLGLALAMRQLAEAIEERSGVHVQLTIAEDIEDLPMEVEQSIYRVTEEALTNVVRHAQAGSVIVTLQSQENKVDLMVTDNGVGFDPETATQNGHYGLIGMKERANLCNGRLHIHSQSQAGTTIHLAIGENA